MLSVERNEGLYEGGISKNIIRKKYDLPLNERLKEARIRKELSLSQTVKELEKRGVKCGQSTLQGYEACESSLYHRYPSLIMLVALADLYECSIDYLFGRSEKINGSRINFKKIKPQDFSYVSIS